MQNDAPSAPQRVAAPGAQELEQLSINTLRFLSADSVQQARSAHPGLPMGAAPLAYTIWARHLRHNPSNPAWANRDRFVLSGGHGCMLLYSLLYLTGYDLRLKELKRFRKWGSLTPGHPEYGLTPGVETTTGPLGQGFANGVGMAMAEAHLAKVFNRPGHEIIDHYVYAIVTDGDLMEGVASEAASLAGHQRLGKLIYLYDDNQISIEGSTDLAPSPNTWIADSRAFATGCRQGRNFHFGVREHGMGAMVNGMAYHGGVIPFGATFMVFSDYVRPALRVAAISHLGSIWVFTHDSIGVGEDGPTHQPVEHLAALRAIPDLVVLRPADANEVREAWKIAIENRHRPTALALTRQPLPTLDRALFTPADGVKWGAYVLADLGEGMPQIILMASGSEVGLIVYAGQRLAEQGVAVRLVSFPSWELFAEQEPAYCDAVLLPEVEARLAVKAGVSQGWHRWVGSRGRVLGLDRYGASAPAKVVFENLGFTVDRAVQIGAGLL
jgi:transketolase